MKIRSNLNKQTTWALTNNDSSTLAPTTQRKIVVLLILIFTTPSWTSRSRESSSMTIRRIFSTHQTIRLKIPTIWRLLQCLSKWRLRLAIFDQKLKFSRLNRIRKLNRRKKKVLQLKWLLK